MFLNKSITAIISVTLLWASCKKGDTGPQGPQGEQGAQGVPGPNGSQILKGTGVPGTTLGANGDYYLDVNTSKLYGPKTVAGWGTPLSLAGAQGAQGAAGATGAAGANGKTILTGTGVPAANIGTTGDFYLDKSTYNFYGPKDASGWNAPVSLKGPQGDQGVKGDPGTANVIYSGWKYAVSFNDSTIDNSSLKVGYVSAPDLTTTRLNNSLIQVYFTYGGGNFILPYTSNAGGKPNTISYTPMNQKILITRFTHDNSNTINLSTLLQYRFIIIPGGVAANAVKKGINPGDYSTTMKFLGIGE